MSTKPDQVQGRAFRFDANGFVTVPDHPTLDLTGEITLEFWFNYDAVLGINGLVAKRPNDFGVTNYGVNAVDPLGLGLYYNDPTVLGGTISTPSPHLSRLHEYHFQVLGSFITSRARINRLIQLTLKGDVPPAVEIQRRLE
jgi:hypothetical protein